jgi:hypothetical protein
VEKFCSDLRRRRSRRKVIVSGGKADASALQSIANDRLPVALAGSTAGAGVATAPLGHFQAEDAPLLCAYVRAITLERRAAEELAAGAVIGSVPSPWLAVHAEMVKALSALSVRLRIGPKSRAPSNNRRSAGSGRTPSAYDVWDKS